MRSVLLLTLLLLCGAEACLAGDMEITPFRTVNQRPLVQIFGLPAETSATITPAGHLSFALTQDVASEYTVNSTSSEQIVLDGESYRWTLAARYGIGERFEAGLEIPYILYGGGFLDGFIEDWHSAFGMPQGGRDTAPQEPAEVCLQQEWPAEAQHDPGRFRHRRHAALRCDEAV